MHVFRAQRFEGEPAATPEAIPLWMDPRALPWDEVWADDRLWVPHLLAGRAFHGRFIFDGEAMLDHVLEVEDAPPATSSDP